MKRPGMKRIAAVLSALLLLPSCGVLEMREAIPETEPASDGLLSQARRRAEEEGEQSPGLQLYTTPPKEEETPSITFAFAGDILIDTFIISDAARKAGEGQSYSFLRTVSGVYRMLESADVTVGYDSSAVHPKGDTDPTHRTPAEALETLANAGYDVLNTLDWDDENGLLADYGVEDLSLAAGGTNAIVIQQEGITVSLLTVGGDVHPIGSEDVNRQIGEAAEASDLVIVMADWNAGMTSGEQCAAAYYMAEAGADVIIGTGDTVGAVDWLDKADGSESLAVYSLGSLLSTSAYYENLTGGILTFTAERRSSGRVAVKDVVLTPTFTHLEKGRREVQVFPLASYRDELAKVHYIGGLTADTIVSYVRSIVPAVYLPTDFRG